MANDFNPDAYLASKESDFDPDSYLSTKEVKPDISKAESLGRGALQGSTFGFSDELSGGLGALWDKLSSDEKSKTFSELYIKNRDESRANNKKAEEANPASYTTGQIGGGIGSAILTAGIAPEVAGVAGAVRAGAAYGALQGAGDSEADSLSGLATDTALGATIGGVTGGAIKAATPYASKAIDTVTSKIPSLNKSLSKIGSFASGADEEALLRQIQRPTEMALAENDGFANNIANKAVGQIKMSQEELGRSVGVAKDNFLAKSGNAEISGIGDRVSGDIQYFLKRNEPSQKGFSALSKSQMSELEDLSRTFSGKMNGDDLLKSREYLDHIEKLAGKYDKEGTGPYISYLKGLRHKLDTHLDTISPEIDKANSKYSDFLSNKKILGLNNESTGESVVDNLYGKNKSAKQTAASKLLSPSTMTSIQDIAANKAIGAATGPSGSDFGRRTMLAHVTAIPTFGLSEVAVSPRAWKHGLRAVGRIENKIALVLKNQPQILGRFSGVLNEANARGATALTSTHFLLSQSSPEYRAKVKEIESMEDEDE